MSYAATCVLLANLVLLPVLGILFWLMGRENWRKWLLIIPSFILMDLDHFILTNVPGFGAHPAPGQKILHLTHTVEFVILEIAVFLVALKLDQRRGRDLKTWCFPRLSDYAKSSHYYLAWTARILAMGVAIHWLLDLIIYTYFSKWNNLYVSLLVFLEPDLKVSEPTLTTVVAYVLIALFFIAVESQRKGHLARSFRPGKFDGGSQRVLKIGLMTLQVFIVLAPVLNHFGVARIAHGELVGWGGVALMIGGIALRYWAGKTLGAFYTRTLLIQTDHRIVKEGPYKSIRHPGYAGALLMWVGAVLATANWLAIAVVTPVIIGAYIYRIRCEEAMLVCSFGEQYRAYQAHTWKLLPFVY